MIKTNGNYFLFLSLRTFTQELPLSLKASILAHPTISFIHFPLRYRHLPVKQALEFCFCVHSFLEPRLKQNQSLWKEITNIKRPARTIVPKVKDVSYVSSSGRAG